MASQNQKLHFLLFPLMAQGHIIPMLDFAKLLSQRGAITTLVTTAQNEARIANILTRATHSGLQIQTAHLPFPCQEAGLPEGCDNMDLLPSLGMAGAFFRATFLMRPAAEKLFEELTPRPTCIISDLALPWTIELAHKFQVPRITFYSLSCFYLVSMLNLQVHKAQENVASESEPFVIPDLPDRIEFTKSQLYFMPDVGFSEFGQAIARADSASHGVVINTFEELETEYVNEYAKGIGKQKLWCIGPVSLGNKESTDMAERGDKAAIDELECLRWLDRQEPGSVVYAALGSLCNVIPAQIIELGLALEESKQPFIWVVRQGDHQNSEEFENWVSKSGFEEKIKDRGLVIRGWAPQVLVLSHPAVGGFITHCGWNSTIEALSAGVPMVTWPLFGDQFFNEKLVVQVLEVGVSVGVEKCMIWGDEERVGVVVKKDAIRDAVKRVMEGEEREERRERARKVAERAKKAVEGGSSELNLTLFIENIMNLTRCERTEDSNRAVTDLLFLS